MEENGQVYFGAEDEIPAIDRERYKEALLAQRDAEIQAKMERLQEELTK